MQNKSRSLVLFSFLLLLPAGATGQESVASWLGELGLDRLRIHALQQRLDVSSIDEEERERVTDQLLALYGTLLAEETDEVFLEELKTGRLWDTGDDDDDDL